jgi:hypothetical protein
LFSPLRGVISSISIASVDKFLQQKFSPICKKPAAGCGQALHLGSCNRKPAHDIWHIASKEAENANSEDNEILPGVGTHQCDAAGSIANCTQQAAQRSQMV